MRFSSGNVTKKSLALAGVAVAGVGISASPAAAAEISGQANNCSAHMGHERPQQVGTLIGDTVWANCNNGNFRVARVFVGVKPLGASGFTETEFDITIAGTAGQTFVGIPRPGPTADYRVRMQVWGQGRSDSQAPNVSLTDQATAFFSGK